MTTVTATKECARCKRECSLAEFGRDRKRKDGHNVYCRECVNAAHRDPEFRARQRSRHAAKLAADPNYRRRRDLQARYGITLEQYFAMLEQQGGGCLICGATDDGRGKALHVDHDHACCPGRTSCGRCVRALLCSPCNTAVGWFETRGADWWRSIAAFIEGVRT
jgi:hypothetical protein